MCKPKPHCRIEFRSCVMCVEVFLTAVRSKKKYCTDLCAAKAVMLRPDNRYTLEGALAYIREQRAARVDRRSVQREIAVSIPTPQAPVPRNPVGNRHIPGSIAFTLLYGTPTFSFNRSDGADRVGRGGSSARAIQVGGPNV